MGMLLGLMVIISLTKTLNFCEYFNATCPLLKPSKQTVSLTTTTDTFGFNQKVSGKTSSKKQGGLLNYYYFLIFFSGNMLNVKH